MYRVLYDQTVANKRATRGCPWDSALAPQRQAFRPRQIATLLDFLTSRPQRLPPDWIRRMMHQCLPIAPPPPPPTSSSLTSRNSVAASLLAAAAAAGGGGGDNAGEGGGNGGGGDDDDKASTTPLRASKKRSTTRAAAAAAAAANAAAVPSNVRTLESEAGGHLAATLRCSDDAAAWWAVQEVARHCVSARLRTHFGNASETLALLEKCLRAAARPKANAQLAVAAAAGAGTSGGGGGGGSVGIMTSSWLLLELMGAIERSLYNAYEGTATLPPPGKTAASFFRANQRVCEDWLGRVREGMLAAAAAVGNPAAGAHHALLRVRRAAAQQQRRATGRAVSRPSIWSIGPFNAPFN